MLTIALIDQHPVARIGLGHLLSQNFEEINLLQSQSEVSFHKQYPKTIPDLVIFGFDKVNSLESSRASNKSLASFFQTGKIIVIDGIPNAGHAVFYLRKNVQGYISKQNDMSEILDCIRLVLDGKRYVDLDLIGQMMQNLLVK